MRSEQAEASSWLQKNRPRAQVKRKVRVRGVEAFELPLVATSHRCWCGSFASSASVVLLFDSATEAHPFAEVKTAPGRSLSCAAAGVEVALASLEHWAPLSPRLQPQAQ